MLQSTVHVLVTQLHGERGRSLHLTIHEQQHMSEGAEIRGK